MLTFATPLSSIIVFVLILFALMLSKLTPRLVLAPLTAAPPHFSSVYSSMRSATPVEVLLLVEFLSTQLTHLDPLVDLAFTTLQFDDTLFHFLTLSLKDFVFLVKLHELIQLLV